MDEYDEPDQDPTQEEPINWWRVFWWVVSSIGVTVLLLPVVAFVLHEKVDRAEFFLIVFWVAVANGYLGQKISYWALKKLDWVVVVLLSVGSSWGLSLIPHLMFTTSTKMVAGFMIGFSFWMGIVGDLSQWRRPPSSSVPKWHPENM